MAIKIRMFDRTKEKVCTKCSELKPLEEFYKNSRTKDGLQYQYKVCTHAYYLRYHKTERGKAAYVAARKRFKALVAQGRRHANTNTNTRN